MSIAGIDIGTTGTKVTVFDLEGRALSQAYREYPLYFPRAGWIELDAARVMRDAFDALAEAAHKTRRDPIRAFSLSTLGEAAAPVGADGGILGNAIVGFDARGVEEMDRLVERFGRAELFRRTGMPPSHIFTIHKIMWWKKHRRDVFRRARRFLTFEDLFFHSLGLTPSVNASLAARTMAYNIHAREWDGEILEAAWVDKSYFARAVSSGDVVGEVPAAAAKRLGLRAGVLAVAGGHDQLASAFGSGVIRAGLACDSTGTVECVTAALDRPILNAKMLRSNFCCSPHVVPGMYATLAYNFTGASLLRWYRDTFCEAEKERAARSGEDVYDVILEGASRKPTNLTVLPHFTSSGTPHFDAGAFGAVVGLKFETTKADFVRSILEGVSMEIRMNMELLKGAGVEVRELSAIGGGARSDYWLRIKADVFGRPVTALDVSEAGGLGAAMLAGISLGEFRDHAQAVKACVRKKKRYSPDLKNAAYYEKRLKAYRGLYPALKKWRELLPEDN